jgi:hypothetical protein
LADKPSEHSNHEFFEDQAQFDICEIDKLQKRKTLKAA